MNKIITRLSILNQRVRVYCSVVECTDVLHVDSWKNTRSFKNDTHKLTQMRYYTTSGSHKDVLKLVKLESKPFGTKSENILREIFGMGDRTSSENDAVFNGKKIEIKCARYWAGCDDCKWQHIELDHDFDYILFGLLDFHGWKVWCLKKEELTRLVADNIIKKQGKQGWWVSKSNIEEHLISIKCIDDFRKYVI